MMMRVDTSILASSVNNVVQKNIVCRQWINILACATTFIIIFINIIVKRGCCCGSVDRVHCNADGQLIHFV